MVIIRIRTLYIQSHLRYAARGWRVLQGGEGQSGRIMVVVVFHLDLNFRLMDGWGRGEDNFCMRKSNKFKIEIR